MPVASNQPGDLPSRPLPAAPTPTSAVGARQCGRCHQWWGVNGEALGARPEPKGFRLVVEGVPFFCEICTRLRKLYDASKGRRRAAFKASGPKRNPDWQGSGASVPKGDR